MKLNGNDRCEVPGLTTPQQGVGGAIKWRYSAPPLKDSDGVG